ncbi:MAG: transglycosylase SLT domain-containing protein [Candidatus Competibacteraceae bacterium]|nr:MAG: transglycosylase SLT domain-containing protein [Candidatus Competibacteraceae bacterium]
MPKPLLAILATLFIASTISACALQPLSGLTETPTTEQAATIPAPYVDYWQTRDPSEYRRDPAPNRQSVAQSRDVVIQEKDQGTGTATVDRQPIAASQDVVIQGKDQGVGTAEKSAKSRVRVVVPVRSGKATDAVARKSSEKPATAAVKTARVATSSAKRNPRLSKHKKGKGSPRLATTAGKGLWKRVRGGLRLADVQHPRVAEQIEAFKRNPAYLHLFSRRAKPFLHYLVEQIHRRGLPMDLVFVPMVESAFEPTAVSPQEAAGLWQIMPATGEERGLLIADGYDGRFDIHTSTDAALGYLRDLNKMFAGDWLLTLAAYNAGPGTVQEAIKASKAARPGAEAQPVAGDPEAATVSEPRPQSLYWDLQLPKETQAYVPKILALAQMVADPQTYGARLPPIDNRAYLFRVKTTPDLKVFDALAFTTISIDEFLRFNPGFKTEVEAPARAYTLLLPWDQARNLVANVPGARFVGPSKYTVKRGDTLEKIAKRHGVPFRQLAQWNGLSADGILKAGQQLTVYPAS